MGAIIEGTLIVLGTTLLSVIGMLLVRRKVSHEFLESHHNVAGYLFSIIGTLYAVLLGLVIVNVQSTYQHAQVMAESEANSAADIFHIASGLPPKERGQIQNLIASYVREVVDSEWDNADEWSHREGSVHPLREVWDVLSQYEPKTSKEQACYSEMLTQMSQLSDSRRFRMVIGDSGVSPVLWGVIISGGFLIVAFTYFFGVADLRTQALMTILVAVFLSLNVMLVALFSNPYKGDLRIRPEGFLYDRRMMVDSSGATVEGGNALYFKDDVHTTKP